MEGGNLETPDDEPDRIALDEDNQKIQISDKKDSNRIIHISKPVVEAKEDHDDANTRYSFPAGSLEMADTEEVPHPATLYGITLPEDLPQTLQLPKFWNPKEETAFGGDVRQYLKTNDGSGLPTLEQVSKIGSYHDGEETILVTIASYRDPECRNTVESIYARAEHPHRIRTVVIDQLRRDLGDIPCTQPTVSSCEDDPEQVLCRYQHLIQSYELDARLAVGPTFARHIANRMYRGEYFVLQVDAHVRFVQQWDSDVIEQWKSAHNEMAVLTTYMLDLNGSIDPDTHASRKQTRALLCNVYWEGAIFKNGQQGARPPGIHGTPTLHPFWAAGLSFSRGHFVLQVPYDQYLPQIFQGEEMSMTLRGFSFGYDYYAPERNICFHMYAVHKFRENRLAVPKFSENKKLFQGVEDQAMKRLVSILGINHTQDDYRSKEEETYGLGKVRSLDTFFATFGIDAEKHTMEDNLCWFVGENMQRVFLPRALRSDGMGIDYQQVNYTFRDPARDQV